MRFFILALGLVFSACSQEPGEDSAERPASSQRVSSADEIGKAIGAGLQGDARYAVELLKAVDASSLGERDHEYRTCMLERFGDSASYQETSPRKETFAGELVDIYVNYWRKALRAPDLRQELTLELEKDLRESLNLPEAADSFQIEPAIQTRLNDEGLHALLGQTGALRELMIWRQEDRRSVTVKMPHGTYATDVAFLDDFVLSGWGQYATCETRGAGGWVADRTLFAVVPSYEDLDGEEFRVTFLGHETQHFLDLEKYPNLESWELEYRAKLMELAMADETRFTVLQKFIEDQGDDPASPHSYANRKILTALVAELPVANADALRSAEGKAVRDAAYGLFKADTASRDR